MVFGTVHMDGMANYSQREQVGRARNATKVATLGRSIVMCALLNYSLQQLTNSSLTQSLTHSLPDHHHNHNGRHSRVTKPPPFFLLRVPSFKTS